MDTELGETFGKNIRDLRLNARIGLRELAACVQISPGYLSDIEQDNVPPPKAEVVLALAEALDADKGVLLSAAGRLDPDVSLYITNKPSAADFLRMARDKGFDDDDWDRLSRMADIARLGKGEK
jgi:transcriptional regulator with XRE-family HTH domain